MATAVASRYAQALADLVLEGGDTAQSEAVTGQLKGMEELLNSSPELRNVLANPAVSPPQKRAVIERFCQMLGTSELVRNFFFVLIDRRRIANLPEIRESFEGLLDERMGVVRARVTSASPLSAEQQERLRQGLSAVAGKQVRTDHAVDAELLGGVEVRLGSTIYDGSLRGRLDALRRKLTE